MMSSDMRSPARTARWGAIGAVVLALLSLASLVLMPYAAPFLTPLLMVAAGYLAYVELRVTRPHTTERDIDYVAIAVLVIVLAVFIAEAVYLVSRLGS